MYCYEPWWIREHVAWLESKTGGHRRPTPVGWTPTSRRGSARKEDDVPRWVVLHATAMTPPVLDWHRSASIHLDVVPTALIARARGGHLPVWRQAGEPARPGCALVNQADRRVVFGLFVTFLAVDSLIAATARSLLRPHDPAPDVRHGGGAVVRHGRARGTVERATTGRTHGLVVRGLGSELPRSSPTPLSTLGCTPY